MFILCNIVTLCRLLSTVTLQLLALVYIALTNMALLDVQYWRPHLIGAQLCLLSPFDAHTVVLQPADGK